MELRIPTSDLAVLLGQESATLDADQLRDRFASFYGFLPGTVEVSIEGNCVVIKWPDTATPDKLEAERLAQKAAQRARRGEHEKARDILKAAIKLDPSLASARRDLAMVCVELGDMDEAKDHLIEVLKLDPKDAWALVILANHYVWQDKDYETAKRFLRRAIELKPDDPWAMNSLGAVLTQTGETEEGAKLCDELILKHPGFPIGYLNKALYFVREQKLPEAADYLRRMFAMGEVEDSRTAGAFRQAREIYAKVQGALANQKLSASDVLVDQMSAKAAEVSGFPIKVTTGQIEGTVAAKVAMAWKYGKDHHLLTLREGETSGILKDHHSLHEIYHVLMESEARKAGTNRWFMTSGATRTKAITAMAKEVMQLERKGYEPQAIADGVTQLYSAGVGFLYNCPLDMFIESRIQKEQPQMAEIQFCGVVQLELQSAAITVRKDLRDFAPPSLQRLSDSVNGAYALFVDDLFGRATAFADLYRPMPTFALSQKLYGAWKDAAQNFKPGDEYALVDAFAEALGVTGWFGWKLDDGTPR